MEKILIGLIEDNIRYEHLSSSLLRLGISAEHYHLNLADRIFELMRLEAQPNGVFEVYLALIGSVGDVKDSGKVEMLARQVYGFLRGLQGTTVASEAKCISKV